MEVEKLDDVDFDIKASNEDLDTSLKLQASTGKILIFFECTDRL